MRHEEPAKGGGDCQVCGIVVAAEPDFSCSCSPQKGAMWCRHGPGHSKTIHMVQTTSTPNRSTLIIRIDQHEPFRGISESRAGLPVLGKSVQQQVTKWGASADLPNLWCILALNFSRAFSSPSSPSPPPPTRPWAGSRVPPFLLLPFRGEKRSREVCMVPI